MLLSLYSSLLLLSAFALANPVPPTRSTTASLPASTPPRGISKPSVGCFIVPKLSGPNPLHNNLASTCLFYLYPRHWPGTLDTVEAKLKTSLTTKCNISTVSTKNCFGNTIGCTFNPIHLNVDYDAMVYGETVRTNDGCDPLKLQACLGDVVREGVGFEPDRPCLIRELQDTMDLDAKMKTGPYVPPPALDYPPPK